MTTNKNIGIVGGSFNPITIGHMQLAQIVAKIDFLDEVWLIPNDKSVFNKELESWDDRYEMVKIVVEKLNMLAEHNHRKIKFKACDIEHALNLDGYTVSLLDALTSSYNYNFYNVIGQDIANTLYKYKFYDKLINVHKFIVVPRIGYEPNENLWYMKEPHIYLKNQKNLIETSSTEVRTSIRNGEAEFLINKLPISILSYILDKKLYANK